ncbi:hypothetical protein NDN08_005282 [Rhodosorus marinus]|uniref:Tim44-like domain-containing protein n=1 Tax=Rhodosorus marinus TaxID=101924 RepID=A0AAV8V4L3_9RHOD|nr:hypothetical protein NDN08_005282 [Rhodosorus marinus]
MAGLIGSRRVVQRFSTVVPRELERSVSFRGLATAPTAKELKIVDPYPVGIRRAWWERFNGYFKTRWSLLRAWTIDPASPDELFKSYMKISKGYSLKDHESLSRLVTKQTHQQMVAALSEVPSKLRVKWEAVEQSRHRIVQNRMTRTKDGIAFQVTLKFRYKRRITVTDSTGNFLYSEHTPNFIEEICVFERLPDDKPAYLFVAKLQVPEKHAEGEKKNGESVVDFGEEKKQESEVPPAGPPDGRRNGRKIRQQSYQKRRKKRA